MRTAIVFILALSASIASGSDRPNIVIILADDFGVGNIQAHYPDNKIATPHLDKLSTESMRFTDAHSGSAVCTPTRYGLLTGRYAWRTRLQEWVLACYEPPLIAEERLTLPEMLQDQGYSTACIGKWHLGWNWAGPQPSTMEEVSNILRTKQWDYTKPMADGPTTRGFDYYFGTHVPNFPPFTFIKNDRLVEQPTARFEYNRADGTFMPQQFDDNPMAPGWEFDQILPTITRKAVEYIHEQADEEQPFFLYFPMTSPHTPLVPSDEFKGKSGIALVADFIMETDWSVGQLLKALDDTGNTNDTLVIFTSDNGHLPQEWDLLTAAGHRPSGNYRGRKADIWEGGHRVPFMVRWPGKVEAGKESDDLLSLNDVFATCADLLGTDLESDVAEDSLSFLSTLVETTDRSHRKSIVAHSVGGEFAYIEDGWKLVYRNQHANRNECRGDPRIVELYHLANDLSESRNLVAQEPEKLAYLDGRLRETVSRGSSRPGAQSANDTNVVIDVTQSLRWAPPR